LVLTILFAPSVFAQIGDFSLWYKRAGGENTVIPWYLYSNKGYILDMRYNFDVLKSSGFFFGKSIESGSVSVIPAAGIIFGDYNSFSPQVYLTLSRGRFVSFSMWQYSWGFGAHGSSVNSDSSGIGGHGRGRHFDYVYHWSDNQMRINDWLSVGLDEQYYKESSKGTWYDLGPAVKIKFGKFYLKPWYSISTGPNNYGLRKLYIGLGYVF